MFGRLFKWEWQHFDIQQIRLALSIEWNAIRVRISFEPWFGVYASWPQQLALSGLLPFVHYMYLTVALLTNGIVPK